MSVPAISVSIATFNNASVVEQCLDGWETFASHFPVELIVVEDGCRDETPSLLEKRASTTWGRAHLRVVHEDNVHELRATNRGFLEARAPLLMTWQDDMFLRCGWLVPELIRTFERYPDLGLLSLSRGLNCYPVGGPIHNWDDLNDWARLQSTIGPKPLNWMRLQEVDIVIRPWIVRRACLDQVGLLDEAFVPTEWDEADLACRIRRAGWRVATHGYERAGAYFHLGSTTVGVLSDNYKARVLRNGLLFHERWDDLIGREGRRLRKTWWRCATSDGWTSTAAQAVRYLMPRNGRRS